MPNRSIRAASNRSAGCPNFSRTLQRPGILVPSVVLGISKAVFSRVFRSGAYRDRTDDLQLAKPVCEHQGRGAQRHGYAVFALFDLDRSQPVSVPIRGFWSEFWYEKRSRTHSRRRARRESQLFQARAVTRSARNTGRQLSAMAPGPLLVGAPRLRCSSAPLRLRRREARAAGGRSYLPPRSKILIRRSRCPTPSWRRPGVLADVSARRPCRRVRLSRRWWRRQKGTAALRGRAGGRRTGRSSRRFGDRSRCSTRLKRASHAARHWCRYTSRR